MSPSTRSTACRPCPRGAGSRLRGGEISMHRLWPHALSGLSAAALLAGTLAAPVLAASPAATHSDLRTVTRGGTITPATGTFTASPSTSSGVSSDEFLGDADEDDGSDQDAANITDRSLSNGQGHA